MQSANRKPGMNKFQAKILQNRNKWISESKSTTYYPKKYQLVKKGATRKPIKKGKPKAVSKRKKSSSLPSKKKTKKRKVIRKKTPKRKKGGRKKKSGYQKKRKRIQIDQKEHRLHI